MKWVLILESSEANRAHLEKIISRLGYQMYSATSGAEALHFISQSLPSAIVAGENLPDYEPLEFCRRLKENIIHSCPPVLLMSSSTDPYYKDSAISAGFTDVVQQPMSIRNFFTKLEMCLSNNRRLCIRAPMELSVQLTHDNREYSFTTHNFGERGMYIPTKNPLPGDAEVGLRFSLPGLRTLFSFKGEVVHIQDQDTDEAPAGMGLKFHDVSSALDAVLGIYMENFLIKRLPAAV